MLQSVQCFGQLSVSGSLEFQACSILQAVMRLDSFKVLDSISICVGMQVLTV